MRSTRTPFKLRFKGARAIIGLTGLVSVLVLAGCGGDDDDSVSGASGSDCHLQVIQPSGSTIIPLYYQTGVAMDAGFFKEEGIDVELLPQSEGSSSTIQQMVAGQGDFSNESPQVIFDTIEQGYADSLVIVATWLYQQQFSVYTFPDKGVTSMADLQGKKIGVSELSGGEVPLLKVTLANYGVTDYDLVPIGDGTPQTIRALQKEDVDAYSTSEKDFIVIKSLNPDLDITPIDIPEWANLTGAVFTATTDVWKNHQDCVVGYMRALAKATIFADENPEATLQIIKDNFDTDLSDEVLMSWLQQAQASTTTIQSISDKTAFTPDKEALDYFLDFYKKAGAIDVDSDFTLADYMDTSRVPDYSDFDIDKVREFAKNYES